MPDAGRRLRFHGHWRTIGLLLILSILVLSLVPVSNKIDLADNSDKLAHFLAYASLMFWFGMLYYATRRRLLLALAFCAMGVGIEFLQGMTSYRSFEIADMLANAVGVATGWCLACTPLQHCLAWFERLTAQKGVA